MEETLGGELTKSERSNQFEVGVGQLLWQQAKEQAEALVKNAAAPEKLERLGKLLGGEQGLPMDQHEYEQHARGEGERPLFSQDQALGTLYMAIGKAQQAAQSNCRRRCVAALEAFCRAESFYAAEDGLKRRLRGYVKGYGDLLAAAKRGVYELQETERELLVELSEVMALSGQLGNHERRELGMGNLRRIMRKEDAGRSRRGFGREGISKLSTGHRKRPSWQEHQAKLLKWRADSPEMKFPLGEETVEEPAGFRKGFEKELFRSIGNCLERMKSLVDSGPKGVE